ncbi:MAG: shikimate kinase [Acidobacteriota bacterium]|nr:shikimate kinase [Acidobacteriota bacterium]
MTTAPHVAPTATMLPLRTPRTPERIVLTGFMGSGKSTVGVLLAAELGWSFIDLDSEIERRTGLNVPQMFAEKGEAAFRKEETAALAAALGCTHAVIALGGGAPETLANRLLLEQTPATTVVYLTAPLVTLAQRCAAQDVLAASPGSTFRPNFADPIAAESKFIARQPIYRRLAHISLETGDLTPEGTVAALLTAVAAKAARA